ncbi:MAG: RNA-binding S4 domain-containing protein [Stellaceae bacterium]
MSESLRLDKWLWQARFAKTRALAARLVEKGAVTLGRRRVKRHHPVRIGDRLIIRHGAVSHTIEVRALGQRRGPAAEARLLYAETMSAIAAAPADWQPLLMDEEA